MNIIGSFFTELNLSQEFINLQNHRLSHRHMESMSAQPNIEANFDLQS